MTANSWWARASALMAVVAIGAFAGGCVNYTQGELAAMSGADICEVEHMQRPNLTPEAKQAIQAELARRNDNCRNHAEEVQARNAKLIETYRIDNP